MCLAVAMGCVLAGLLLGEFGLVEDLAGQGVADGAVVDGAVAPERIIRVIAPSAVAPEVDVVSALDRELVPAGTRAGDAGLDVLGQGHAGADVEQRNEQVTTADARPPDQGDLAGHGRGSVGDHGSAQGGVELGHAADERPGEVQLAGDQRAALVPPQLGGGVSVAQGDGGPADQVRVFDLQGEHLAPVLGRDALERLEDHVLEPRAVQQLREAHPASEHARDGLASLLEPPLVDHSLVGHLDRDDDVLSSGGEHARLHLLTPVRVHVTGGVHLGP